MSGVLNSSFLNGSATNITHGGGRSFSSSFSAQPRAGPPVFHHTGIQGLHNMRTDFNVPSMVVSLSSRNAAIHGVPSGGMQQSSGNLLAGLFGSNNIQDQLSQISHVVSDGHSGITNRGGMNIVGSPDYSNSSNVVGGSIHGVLPTSAAAGNRGAIPGLGVSPMMGNAGSRITSSMGNIVGSGNIGRNMSSGGGLSVPGLSPRLNFMSNNGSGNSGLQGPNGLMGGVLQQASPQVAIGCLPSDSVGVEFDLELSKEWEVRSAKMNKIYMCVADINNLLYIADRFNQSGYMLYSSEETLKILEDNGINAFVPHEVREFDKVKLRPFKEIKDLFRDYGFEQFDIFVMNGMTSRLAVAVCAGAVTNFNVVVVDPADYKLVSDLLLSHHGLSKEARHYLWTKAAYELKRSTDRLHLT